MHLGISGRGARRGAWGLPDGLRCAGEGGRAPRTPPRDPEVRFAVPDARRVATTRRPRASHALRCRRPWSGDRGSSVAYAVRAGGPGLRAGPPRRTRAPGCLPLAAPSSRRGAPRLQASLTWDLRFRCRSECATGVAPPRRTARGLRRRAAPLGHHRGCSLAPRRRRQRRPVGAAGARVRRGGQPLASSARPNTTRTGLTGAGCAHGPGSEDRHLDGRRRRPRSSRREDGAASGGHPGARVRRGGPARSPGPPARTAHAPELP